MPANTACRQVVAPIHLIQSRVCPLGSPGPPRGGAWGMNTPSPAATPYTPLETVLLFRGLAQYGLEAPAFARVAEALQSNRLVKNGPTFDARRLSPASLQDFFLRLLREEELQTESPGGDAPGPDGSLSPSSRKRRLQPSALPALTDARRHVDKIESAYARLRDAYVRDAVRQIRQLERQFDLVQAEIDELERLVARAPADGEPRPQSPAAVQDSAPRRDPALPNGVGPSPVASPRPTTPRVSTPQPPPQPPPQPAPPPQPLRTLHPLLPQPPPRQDVRSNGPAPPLQTAHSPRSPALNSPQLARSPQPGQQETPKAAVARPPDTPRPPNGTPQVLQPPQGVVPSFQPPPRSPAPTTPAAEPLQRPDGVAASSRPSPAAPPASTHLPPQGQLKWEPPYQPGAPAPRQAANADLQHQSPGPFPPLQHILPSQRPPQQQQQQQHPPHPAPPLSHLQSQPARPLPQQLLIPPHATSQFAPALQSPPVRPSPESSGPGSVSGRQHQPLLPSGSVPQPQPQPQSPYHPPPHPSYHHPLSTVGHPSPAHAPQAARVNAPPVPPVRGRSPVIPPRSASPATVPSRPPSHHGLAAPPQQRPQPPALQAPPPYGQQTAPPPVPSPAAPALPDASRMYNPPYQPPRLPAVDRIHPRQPTVVTPTPPVRLGSVPSAPQTPATALPPRFAVGSGTKWRSASTPSTPRQGAEFRLGYDDVPSPAFEPASPVLQPSAPHPARPQAGQEPGEKSEPQSSETPASAKRRPGRPPAGQRGGQGAAAVSPSQTGAPPPPAGQSTSHQASEVSQGTGEREPPRIKDEVTTPRPPTETGDTTADESVTGRAQPPRSTKRKREDLTPTPAQTPAASRTRDGTSEGAPSTEGPKYVLWTRSFNKVCGSAMEQIIHHRSANMFAAPIREKDAPGYHKVVKHPQDLKSIRAAINHGNRAAAQAAAALPDGDPGSSNVWLPRTEDLVPPRSIINSSQLDRELAHMFSNAIMYNPDPFHGPGPSFLRESAGGRRRGDGDGLDGGGGGAGSGGAHPDSGGTTTVLGYKVDEFGVINDARAMFVEVEKLLSELRAAEIQRTPAPPAFFGPGTGTSSTRQASVQQQSGHGQAQSQGQAQGAAESGGGGGGGGRGQDEDTDGHEQDQHHQGGSEADTVGGAVKRRRLTRN